MSSLFALTVNGKGREGSGTSKRRHALLRRCFTEHVAAGGCLVALQEWALGSTDAADLTAAGLKHSKGQGNTEASVAYDPRRVYVRELPTRDPSAIRDSGGRVEDVVGAAMMKVRAFPVMVQPKDASCSPFIFVSFHGIARWRAEWEVIYSAGMRLPDVPAGKHGVFTRRCFLATVARMSARKFCLVVVGGDWNVLGSEDKATTEELMHSECAAAARAASVAWCCPRYAPSRELRKGLLDFFVLFAPTTVMESVLSTPRSAILSPARAAAVAAGGAGGRAAAGVACEVPAFAAAALRDDPDGKILDHDPVLISFRVPPHTSREGAVATRGVTAAKGSSRPSRHSDARDGPAVPAVRTSRRAKAPPLPTADVTSIGGSRHARAATRPAEGVRCDACGKVMNARGLAIHRAKMH